VCSIETLSCVFSRVCHVKKVVVWFVHPLSCREPLPRIFLAKLYKVYVCRVLHPIGTENMGTHGSHVFFSGSV
jgi:hypothetical protein